MLVHKKFNQSLCDLINYSFLKSFSKGNSRNYTFLMSKNHVKPKTEIFQKVKTKINPFITKTHSNLLLNLRYNFSSFVQSQENHKQVLQVFEDIVAKTITRCQQNGQYTVVYLISQARQIYPKLLQSNIQDLVILSKNLLTKAQKLKEINQGKISETPFDLSAQLSFWLLLRIYVSSVAFSRVCLNIYSLDRINANQDKDKQKKLKYSQKVKDDVFCEMANSLTELDSFKLKYRDSEVHKKLQKHISQGLEEFSLCRKKNITREEVLKIKVNPKEFKPEQFEKNQEQFLRQMSKLRQLILTSNYHKVNQMFVTNSLLTIMSNKKFKQSQANYLRNSVQRLPQLSSLSAISFAQKISRLKQFKLTESPQIKERRLLIKNTREIQKEIRFMVEKLIEMNNSLGANQLPPFRRFLARLLNGLFYFVVIVVGLVYAVVTVKQWFNKLFNNTKKDVKE